MQYQNGAINSSWLLVSYGATSSLPLASWDWGHTWWTPLSNLLSWCTSYFNIQLVELAFGGKKNSVSHMSVFLPSCLEQTLKKLLGRNVKQPNLLQNMSRLIAGFTHELCRLFPKILILLDTMIHIPFLGKTSASLQISPSIM